MEQGTPVVMGGRTKEGEGAEENDNETDTEKRSCVSDDYARAGGFEVEVTENHRDQ